MAGYSLGIDIGGTFTDILLMDDSTGRYSLTITPPADFSGFNTVRK